MTIKELKERRAALVAEVNGVTEEKRFAEIKTEIAKIDFQIEEAEKDEAKRSAEKKAEEERAAREPSGAARKGKVVLFDNAQAQGEGAVEMSKETALRCAKSAFGKQIRAMLTNTEIKLNEGEKRALGVAVTTTSEVYAAPSANADGVNNGGVFIPQNVLYDLLEIDSPDSPFLRDVSATHITGAIIFPYVYEAVAATRGGKAEKVASDDRSIKWDKLTLAQGNYPLTIEVTMELLAMTDEQFAEYLLADLNSEVAFLLADETFYGTGLNNRIEGVTVGAIAGTPYSAGGEADAIKAGLLALSRRARKGAKVYISRSMSLDMTFEKDDNGRYIFPIYNSTGISTIATVPVEVDENLHDGDFVIGCATNYKLNFTKPTEVYPELHGKYRVIEYTAHVMVAGKAAPNKFYYGKKAVASGT